MQNIPFYVASIFILTVLLASWFFAKATYRDRSAEIVLAAWLTMQSMLGALGFYTVANPTPPRFPLLLVPPILIIATLFISKGGKAFIDTLDIRTPTLMHVVRVPV